MGNILELVHPNRDPPVEVYRQTIPSAEMLLAEWHQTRHNYLQYVLPGRRASPEDKRPAAWAHLRNHGQAILVASSSWPRNETDGYPGQLHFNSPRQTPGMRWVRRVYLPLFIGHGSRVIVANDGEHVCVTSFQYSAKRIGVREFSELRIAVFKELEQMQRVQRTLFLDETRLSRAASISDFQGGLGICFAEGTLFWAVCGAGDTNGAPGRCVALYMCPAGCSLLSHSSADPEVCSREHGIAVARASVEFDWTSPDFRWNNGAAPRRYEMNAQQTSQALREIASPLDWEIAAPFISHLVHLDSTLAEGLSSPRHGVGSKDTLTLPQGGWFGMRSLVCKVDVNAGRSSVQIALEVLRATANGTFEVTEHALQEICAKERILDAFQGQMLTVRWLVARAAGHDKSPTTPH